MSKKHFDEYYEKVCKDYKELLETLKDLEDECNRNLVSPDRLEQFKQTLQPVKLNYQTLSWIKFLLNKPNKKQKQEKYTNQQKSFLEAIGNERSPENVLKENKTTIEKLKL